MRGVRLRFDLVHRADGDAEDADLVAGVEAVGVREVGDEGVPVDALPPRRRHHGDRDGKDARPGLTAVHDPNYAILLMCAPPLPARGPAAPGRTVGGGSSPGAGADSGWPRRRPTGRGRRQRLPVRVARIAGITRNRVGQRQVRLAALAGPRIGHRQRRGAGLAGRRVDELRRQQHVGIQPQIGERRVDERLGELAGNQVDQGGLEERPGAQHLAERHGVPPQQIQGALQFLLAVVQDSQHAVELVERGLELRPVVVDQSGDLLRHRRQVVHQRVDRIALRQKLGQQRIGVDHQAGDLVAALGQHTGDLVGVGQQVAQLRVAGVEGVGEPGHPLQRDLQVGRGVLEGLRQCGQRRGQLGGVQTADGGGQVAQRVGRS